MTDAIHEYGDLGRRRVVDIKDVGEEYDRITDADGTYCSIFGSVEITGGLSVFLGYFMPHKVIAGKETMKAAGTATKKS